MGQAHPSDALAVLVVTRDETRARQLAPTKVHSTYRSENNIPLIAVTEVERKSKMSQRNGPEKPQEVNASDERKI